jgi:predicted nuclease of predicted toxin-antitoxin system
VRFLADEHIPRFVVMALRSQGHEVSWVTEAGAGQSDESHLETARSEDRTILSEDADFSALVSASSGGARLIYFRLDGLGRNAKFQRMLDAIAEIGEVPAGTIYVVEPSRIRVRPVRTSLDDH